LRWGTEAGIGGRQKEKEGNRRGKDPPLRRDEKTEEVDAMKLSKVLGQEAEFGGKGEPSPVKRKGRAK